MKPSFRGESLKESESQPQIKRPAAGEEDKIDERLYSGSNLVRMNTSQKEKKETVKSALNEEIPIKSNLQYMSEEIFASANKIKTAMPQNKPIKYGNDMIGYEMKKTFDKMRLLLENYKVKEEKWTDEKMGLISRIATLENKLSRYEKDIYQ